MPTAEATPAACRALSSPRRDAFYAAWFAQLGGADAPIARLGVTPERAIEHLLGATLPRAASRIRFSRLDLPGLAVAIAAVDGSEDAWRQIESLSPLLSRALLGSDSPHGPAAGAQRYLSAVREATEAGNGSALDLQSYAGTPPLRLWLVDGLFASPWGGAGKPRDLASRESLRRAVGRLDLQRDRLRSVVGIDSEARVRRVLSED